ncbi:hypothetical protein T4B_10117 [Trichinella pseudospiralis]|uniref:EGF-like domain-containing protein n=1 Tax=Trichinella pseudospiralis TaxID=6337 RepID=A0A0V1JGK4_TRIPS|nr:hypothetical protein T4A_9112 [Trichinella pseudospiralis]KRZ34162.1 hypothetical protein T4B_10117 [Trichinella pseudospiralis]KRZ44976.1 hypothetical protein T4C_3667 [Trichinella pseudospiralis]
MVCVMHLLLLVSFMTASRLVTALITSGQSCPSEVKNGIVEGFRLPAYNTSEGSHCVTFISRSEITFGRNGDVFNMVSSYCAKNFKNGFLPSFYPYFSDLFPWYHKENFHGKANKILIGESVLGVDCEKNKEKCNIYRIANQDGNISVYACDESTLMKVSSDILFDQCSPHQKEILKNSTYPLCRSVTHISEDNTTFSDLFPCNNGTDFWDTVLCIHDGYNDCIVDNENEEIANEASCIYRQPLEGCFWYKKRILQHAELPYGRDCIPEFFTFPCPCPCDDSAWQQWSPWNAHCGFVQSIRYRAPNFNKHIDCTWNKLHCCREIRESYLLGECNSPLLYAKQIAENKKMCKNNGSVVHYMNGQTECFCLSGYYDKCDSRDCGTNGKCIIVDGEDICLCDDGNIRQNCSSHPMEEHFENSSHSDVPIILILTLLLFLVIIAAYNFKLRQYVQNVQKSSESEENRKKIVAESELREFQA